jgi:opacity protein-like surface antigen
MKKLFASVFLLLGSVSAAQAQVSVPTPLLDAGNAAPDFSATSAAKATLFNSLTAMDTFLKPASPFASSTLTTALPANPAPADPASPAPKPKFLYGGRDDYRWELSLGAAGYRFQSNVFNASGVGIMTSVTYFLNEWFAVEGNVAATFAPAILKNEDVKFVTYGGGAKIAWRQKRWEPWLHGIFGGAHEQPLTAAGSRNSYSIQVGGGADYRWNPRVSFRFEGDYVRTGFFKQGQNNLLLAGGIVFHF